jgi:hypothetical protein
MADCQNMPLPLDSHLPAYLQPKDSTSCVSVIEKCPIEVLTDIFLYCLEDHGCEIETLLFVCKHWYIVITHTPFFWTNIFVSIRGPPSSAAPRLRFVKAFIERSKESPLDIKVDCGRVARTWVDHGWQVYGPALDLLRDNMYRWRTLHVILTINRALGEFICTLFKGSTPNLVKLSVQNFQFRSIQPVLFSELTNLRTLEMDVYPFKKMINSLPLASLHSLDINLQGLDTWIGKYGYSNWTTDVSRLRSLRSLQIRYPEHGRYLADLSPASVSLPLLQELSIWNFSDPSLRLELPALRTLTFDRLHMPETSPIEVVWRPASRILSKHLKGFLKGAIIHYRSAKRFVVPHWSEKEVVDTLREMKKEGTTLSTSVSFMKENDAYERELIRHDVIWE